MIVLRLSFSRYCKPRQDSRGGEDLYAGAERIREGIGCGAQIDAEHGQQPGSSLCGPRQDG